MITLAAAMRDPKLLGRPFAAPSFWPWHTVAKLISGEPLDDREADLFRQCTGRSRLPEGPVNRLYLLVGRRGGKDRFASAVAVHTAALAANWSEILSAGEQGVVILIGADKRQATILRRYCRGLVDAPLLRPEVVRETREQIEIRTGSALEVIANDARLIRGRSAIAVLGSEACHWRTDEDNASSDIEVVAAAEPSLAMTPNGGLLLLASSPHRRKGLMFNRWRDLWGNDDADAIVWVGRRA